MTKLLKLCQNDVIVIISKLCNYKECAVAVDIVLEQIEKQVNCFREQFMIFSLLTRAIIG